MMQETPEHVFLVIFNSVLQGTSIYLILRSYLHKYQKSYWFSIFIVGTEILHKIFRAMVFYWVSKEVWALEYFLYNLCLFLLIIFLLKGNPWRHLRNIFCGYFIFNLVGTVSTLSVLYVISGFDLDAAVYAMSYGNIEYTGWVFLNVIACIYISKKICETFLKIKHKWVEYFKIIQAFIWIMVGFSTNFEMVFVGIVAFVILVIICIADQRRKYRQLINEYAQLDQMNRDYTGKLEEMSKVRHDISNHLAAADITEHYRDDIIGNIAYVEDYTEIRALDCLLEYKIQICREEKIGISVEGCKLSDYPVKVYDWVGIFSNLLDNAIEACKDVERAQDRFIRIEMENREAMLMIRIVNSKNPMLQEKPGDQKELKDPYKDKRGLGLAIVRETTADNHAIMKAEDKGTLFEVEIDFPK